MCTEEPELTYAEAKKPLYGIVNNITRIEVIGQKGRKFVSRLTDGKYELSYQDDGKTLKLFETPK
jgi:hypothetical protein